VIGDIRWVPLAGPLGPMDELATINPQSATMSSEKLSRRPSSTTPTPTAAAAAATLGGKGKDNSTTAVPPPPDFNHAVEAIRSVALQLPPSSSFVPSQPSTSNFSAKSMPRKTFTEQCAAVVTCQCAR